MRKIIAVALITIMLLSMSTVALAGEDKTKDTAPPSSAKFTYISSCSTSLGINSSGKAAIVDCISAYSNVDKVVISTYLQKYENGTWVTVQHWVTTEYDNFCAITHYHYVVSGNKYRSKVYYYAYDGSDYESTCLYDYESY